MDISNTVTFVSIPNSTSTTAKDNIMLDKNSNFGQQMYKCTEGQTVAAKIFL